MNDRICEPRITGMTRDYGSSAQLASPKKMNTTGADGGDLPMRSTTKVLMRRTKKRMKSTKKRAIVCTKTQTMPAPIRTQEPERTVPAHTAKTAIPPIAVDITPKLVSTAAVVHTRIHIHPPIPVEIHTTRSIPKTAAGDGASSRP